MELLSIYLAAGLMIGLGGLGAAIGVGRLMRVLEEWGGVERDVVAIYQNRTHLSAKVKLFVDFMQQRFGQQRPW